MNKFRDTADRLVHKRRIEAAKLAKRQCILGFIGNCQTTTSTPAASATPSPVIETRTTTVQGSTVRQTVTQTPPAPPPQAPAPALAPPAVTVTTTQGRQAFTITASQAVRASPAPTPESAESPPRAATAPEPSAEVVTVPETVTTTINGQTTVFTTDVIVTVPVSVELASSTSAPVATEYLVPIILLNGSTLTTAMPMSEVQSMESASLVTDLGDGTLSQLPASLPTSSAPSSSSAVTLAFGGSAPPGTVTATASPAFLTASATPQVAETSNHSGGASSGLIAGCVVGGVAVAALVMLLAAWCFRRREQKKRRRAQRAVSELYGSNAIYPFADNRQSYAPSAYGPADEGYISHGVPPRSLRTESPLGSGYRGPASEIGRGPLSADFLAVPARSPGTPSSPSTVGGEVGSAMLSPRSDAGRRITFQDDQPVRPFLAVSRSTGADEDGQRRESRLSRAFSFLRPDPSILPGPPPMRPLNLPSRSAMVRRREPTPVPSMSEADEGDAADQAWLDEILDGSKSSDVHVPGQL